MKKIMDGFRRRVFAGSRLWSRRFIVAWGITVLIAGSLAGCGGDTPATNSDSNDQDSKEAVELQVFAANSLEKAMPEVQELYTEKTGVTFADTQFKASGDLIEQMRAGATGTTSRSSSATSRPTSTTGTT